MGKGFFKVPKAVNEPVKSYAPGSPEREAVLKAYKELWNTRVDAPLYIGSEEVRTGNTSEMHPHTTTSTAWAFTTTLAKQR